MLKKISIIFIFLFLFNTLYSETSSYYIQGIGYGRFGYIAFGKEQNNFIFEASVDIYKDISEFNSDLSYTKNGCISSLCSYTNKISPLGFIGIGYYLNSYFYIKGEIGYGRFYQYEYINFLREERKIIQSNILNNILDYPSYNVEFKSDFICGIGVGLKYNIYKNKVYIGLEYSLNSYINPSTEIKLNLIDSYLLEPSLNLEKIILTKFQIENNLVHNKKMFYPRGFHLLRFFVGYRF